MGTDTGRIPADDGADALAYGLHLHNFYDKLWGNEAPTISAAAWDNLRAGSPHWMGVDFAQAEDRTAAYLFGNWAGKSSTQRTRDPRMNQEETRAAAKVMQAFADGKVIQYRPRNRSGALAFDWADCKAQVGVTLSWDFNWGEYRIKPEAPKPRRLYQVEYNTPTHAEPFVVGTFESRDKATIVMYAERDNAGERGKLWGWRVVEFVQQLPEWPHA